MKWKNERSHKIQINKRKTKIKTNLYYDYNTTTSCQQEIAMHIMCVQHTLVKASLKQRYNIIWNPYRKVRKTSINYYKTS